jgi:S-DNA-T family DNA segregation ATPase FtsK/SpoIIIE
MAGAAQVQGGRKPAARGQAARGGGAAATGARPGLWGPLRRHLRAIWDQDAACRFRGALVATTGAMALAAFLTFHPDDHSWNAVSSQPAKNLLGAFGARLADAGLQSLGVAAWVAAVAMMTTGFSRALARDPRGDRWRLRGKAALAALGVLLLAAALAGPRPPAAWPLARGLGGVWGEGLLWMLTAPMHAAGLPGARVIAALLALAGSAAALICAAGLRRSDFASVGAVIGAGGRDAAAMASRLSSRPAPAIQPKPKRAATAVSAAAPAFADEDEADDDPPFDIGASAHPQVANIKAPKASNRETRENQKTFEFVHPGGFQLPELAMLAKPKPRQHSIDEASLRQNARLLETVLGEFGVKGQIDQIRPGPVVTLYELVPAAGVKSSRVISLSDDIARSMSARSARVSVVQGRNAIGIELPNQRRETVYLRDLLSSSEYEKTGPNIPMALGETIGGEP